jgi:hypothetical protein
MDRLLAGNHTDDVQAIVMSLASIEVVSPKVLPHLARRDTHP